MTDAGNLAIRETPIPGLLFLDLPVHGDRRGWFKENWQRDKMTGLGLPDFGPVQQNVSFNAAAGTTRGIHAEPWDKLISVVTGRVLGVWVDLRAGEGFGRVVTREVDPAAAVFVPRGVGNGFQTLEPDTAYSYLVNEHWRPDAAYTMVNLADPELGIEWPIPLDRAVLSDADRTHPMLEQVVPAAARSIAILGGGQVASALLDEFPDARQITRSELDLSDLAAVEAYDLSRYDVVINAAAYTAVDEAETAQGRREAWAVNASAVAALTRAVNRARATLVHFSTDYVFDGADESWGEDSPLAPLSVYGQSKAAGDLAAGCAQRHYLIRTSWVIGAGHNFVATMRRLADQGVSPKVVDDQRGRLSHTATIAAAVAHLLRTRAPHGTYNVTDAGPSRTWAGIAQDVFTAAGREPGAVAPVSSAEFFGDRPHAPRPANSTLRLDKIEAAGYRPPEHAMQGQAEEGR